MTRLSDAMRRAAEMPTAPPDPQSSELTADWQFAPVETMYVPDEPPSSTGIQDLHLTPPSAAADAGGSAPEVNSAPVEPPLKAPVGKAAAPRALQFGEEDRPKMVIGENVDPALVEQYRHLAAKLHHASEASGVRSVMVTSALPAEGKTLTATNLALTLSESYQRRVLLIDADLRRPRLREMFTLNPAKGLTDALTMPATERLPVNQVTPQLWVLTAGSVVPDPMSLLVSPAMKQLIDDACGAFDWVIVDTPPIAILPDANLLATMIDTTVLVVSAQSTPYPMVRRAVEAIDKKRVLGVVLNRATTSALPKNYAYYGYQRGSQGSGGRPAKRRWFGWLRRRHVQ